MQGKESSELRLGLESCEVDRSERFLSEVRKVSEFCQTRAVWIIVDH